MQLHHLTSVWIRLLKLKPLNETEVKFLSNQQLRDLIHALLRFDYYAEQATLKILKPNHDYKDGEWIDLFKINFDEIDDILKVRAYNHMIKEVNKQFRHQIISNLKSKSKQKRKILSDVENTENS